MAWWIWLIIGACLIGLEFATMEMISIWFGVSALITSIVSAIFPTLHWGWQCLIFVVIALVLLIATRPLCKKLMKNKSKSETNLDLVVNHRAVVSETIDNTFEKGHIIINGLPWTARSVSDEVIPEGVVVRVVEIKGNKAFVQKWSNEEN